MKRLNSLHQNPLLIDDGKKLKSQFSTMQKYNDNYRYLNSRHDGEEFSASLSPCCFNLAKDGEEESTFDVKNKNWFPIYFKCTSTNDFAMLLTPICGKVEPFGKVGDKVFFN